MITLIDGRIREERLLPIRDMEKRMLLMDLRADLMRAHRDSIIKETRLINTKCS